MLDRVLAVRRGGRVRRYHVEHISPQENSSHQWGVAALLYLLHPAPSPALIKAALFHDVPEAEVGDLPAPVKWRYPALKILLAEAETEVAKRLDIDVELDEDEEHWLYGVDYLEAALYAYEQRRMGNREASPIFWRVRWAFQERADYLPGPIGDLMESLHHKYLDQFGDDERVN